MNHLEAFCSDDGKRGRVWQNEEGVFYRRTGPELQVNFYNIASGWRSTLAQLAQMEGTVTWADEPKTLTPAEALRALADGKCIQAPGGYPLKVDEKARHCVYKNGRWFECTSNSGLTAPFRIVPDPTPSAPTVLPSQPAEPTKPSLKVGDRVKRGPDWVWGIQDCGGLGTVTPMRHGNGKTNVMVRWDAYDKNDWYGEQSYRYGLDGKYDIEKIEAAPAESLAPPFKAGDRVRVVRNSFGACDNTVGALGTVLRFNSTSDIDVRSDLDGISWCFDETDLVLVEAEQPEYPLTYAEALVALHDGCVIASSKYPDAFTRVADNGRIQWMTADGHWVPGMYAAQDLGEKHARWRIVPTEGK